MNCGAPYIMEFHNHGVLTPEGTHYVKMMGRLRGIDPPFSRHWEMLDTPPPFFFKVPEKSIDFRPPVFRYSRKKIIYTLFLPRHRL